MTSEQAIKKKLYFTGYWGPVKEMERVSSELKVRYQGATFFITEDEYGCYRIFGDKVYHLYYKMYTAQADLIKEEAKLEELDNHYWSQAPGCEAEIKRLEKEIYGIWKRLSRES